ncbi:MAG TPA: hypothetical protein VFW44_11400 [Bryobacteraceae bacterium]|nr:hypothetical protein [Bryobacteraceae bacterium]
MPKYPGCAEDRAREAGAGKRIFFVRQLSQRLQQLCDRRRRYLARGEFFGSFLKVGLQKSGCGLRGFAGTVRRQYHGNAWSGGTCQVYNGLSG